MSLITTEQTSNHQARIIRVIGRKCDNCGKEEVAFLDEKDFPEGWLEIRYADWPDHHEKVCIKLRTDDFCSLSCAIIRLAPKLFTRSVAHGKQQEV